MPRATTTPLTATPPASDRGRGQKVQSAEVAVTVLKALAALGGAATLTRLALQLQEHPAKVHRYLSSLVSSGFVEQDPITARYFLGSEAIFLGLAAQRQSDVLRLCTAEIAKVTEDLGVSCLVAVMGNQGPVIVRWEEPVQAIVVNVRAGFVMPVLWSATGRAFAAFQRSAVVEAVITRELAAATAQQRRELPDRKAVEAMLAGYRPHGCTWLRDQPLKGVGSLAAPVFEANGQVAAVVVALGVAETFDLRPDGPNAKVLRAAAQSVSQRLGHAMADAS
ncbi:IclR family transcriptional regulator [Ramlibacter rhizophilus]|uniref:IclR family transcriptional regulator n=1 Tax=Ramlibacter rhizophilus TaxID=1781167 RepID=A0A4Z0BP80_9BURK|nr:helix-turn-helix domain-containing protein [Ramlibacter rhizophilus]TFY99758.1 IclR family transcriptional regulator [Ramlibacter rhizophilus]